MVPKIPSQMRGVLANKLGPVDEALSFSDKIPVPTVKAGSGNLLVKVKACSLTPGDWRRLSGAAALFIAPPTMPYIPGLDICGTVVQVDPEAPNQRFKVGDEVVGTWEAFGVGGMAEYALVSSKIATLKPSNISAVEGAAMSNSPAYALTAFKTANIKPGDRVLVLGGSGGIGTTLVQLLKRNGASFVACTSTDEPLMKSLGVDKVVNYREASWSEDPEFLAQPFDVIFDCAEGLKAWNEAKKCKVLKSGWNGGRFISLMMKEWHIEIRSYSQALGLMLPIAFRTLFTSLFTFMYPRYRLQLTGVTAAKLDVVAQMVEEQKLRIVVDPQSPYPFTLDGVKGAFNQLVRKAGHGKIVVQVSD